MVSVLAVMTVMAAMVAASAMPALADGRSGSAPNCERGQITAFIAKAFNDSVNDNPEKSFGKIFDCFGNNF